MTDFTELLDLAAERLGGAVMAANDDFFAPKENLLRAAQPVWREGEYTDRGKWMDGWESRRRRTPGFDWAIVRLGLPGIVRGVVVDTAFFRGNYPEHASVEGCAARPDATVEELTGEGTRWTELVPRSPLKGDSRNVFTVDMGQRVTHLRLNIFPDGGVARLRVHGEAVADWRTVGARGAAIDLAAAEHGGLSLGCNDSFFGGRNNLVMPGRSANMGDGWETRRKRVPGHDWNIVQLCAEGLVHRVEVDTNHFKGNYPDGFSLEGTLAPGATLASLTGTDTLWTEILPRMKLQAHTRHFYDDALRAEGPFTHVRLNIFPDGGVSRLRVHGTVTPAGLTYQRLRRLNALSVEEATAELLACCGSTAWAQGMAARRPFTDLPALLQSADAVWATTGPTDWLEAFSAHPRIGERKAQVTHGARAQGWATQEQSGMATAGTDVRDALAAANARYEARFGHVYIVCATGLSGEAMLAQLEARMANPPDAERAVAAGEQHKITRLRLEKLVTL